ncbi:MAG: carbohydrate-binding family 9-like protein [Staphylococcus sp.]|nr:carbohydrate-binding family 9-like protein [Staphylococcus sp.]
MDMTLHIPYVDDLDYLNTDAIFNRLESAGERHNIGQLNWKDDYPYHPLTTFTIAHSAKFIYVNFFVRCNYLRAVNYENNSPVHEDSCVMFYVGRPDSGEYLALEFNCIGTIKAERCGGNTGVTPLSDSEIGQISVLPSCGRRPFREIEGLFTWDLLVAIPLGLLGVEFTGKPLGLTGNFFKCASGTSQPHFLSWAPVESAKPDFRRPESFGSIVLD